MQIESRNSLVRRFSARYFVQGDYPGDCKKLFSSPVGHTTGKKRSKDEGASHIVSEDRLLQEKEIEEVRNYSEHVFMRVLYRLIEPCPSFSNQT